MENVILTAIEIFLVIVLIILLFSGCSECTKVETLLVDATIVYAEHEDSRTVPMWTGKVMTIITYPEKFRTRVEYNGQSIIIDDEDVYEYAKDKVGGKLKCHYTTRYYEDGNQYSFLSEAE